MSSNIIGKVAQVSKAIRMALKTPPITPPVPGDGSLTVDFFKTYISLYRKEIEDWERARECRRNTINPTTIQIQTLYQDNMVDRFLFRQIANRILRVSNRELLIKDKDGKIDSIRSAAIQSKHIRTIIKRAVESKFYGYSMLFISEWEPGKIKKVIDIPRGNIIPETGMLLKDALQPTTGIKYAEWPNFLIYQQLGSDTIGELENISPLTILKRHSWASWDEFEQIFGIPLRIAKTMVDTQAHRDDLEFWLQNMGQAAYAILPKTVDVEIKENSQTDSYNVFNEKRKAVNEEIAIAVNGQTMTTLDGSSRSQSEVHLKTLEEITAEDLQDVRDWFNDDFIPVLRNLGYDIPEGYYFDLVASNNLPIVEKIKIDEAITKMGFQLDATYVSETYNVTLDKENPRAEKTQLDFFV